MENSIVRLADVGSAPLAGPLGATLVVIVGGTRVVLAVDRASGGELR